MQIYIFGNEKVDEIICTQKINKYQRDNLSKITIMSVNIKITQEKVRSF